MYKREGLIMKELKAGNKFFIALWVLSDDALSLLLTGYTMDVPVDKYFLLCSAP